MPFVDRRDAGRRLAEQLGAYAGRDDLLVLALPRGGVPVAAEVAEALGAPLDVFVVRKLGLPGQEELAVGAIASGGALVWDAGLARRAGLTDDDRRNIVARAETELSRRERLYRGDRQPVSVRDRTVLLVDDGLATGSSMRAAIVALREGRPKTIVAAVPVAPSAACRAMARVADAAVCVETPSDFRAVGEWYENFEQTTDDEVRELLARHAEPPAPAGISGKGPS